MRPPRFHFPDHVRSTTRDMASRMVQDGTVPSTPGELDAWVARTPDVRESLESGGYGTHFTADDLLPLLEVFVAKAGGARPQPAARPRSSPGRGVILAVVAAVVIVAAVLAVATGALSR
jgi:hypothetical protein